VLLSALTDSVWQNTGSREARRLHDDPGDPHDPFEVIMIPLSHHHEVRVSGFLSRVNHPFAVSAFGIFLMRQYYISFPDAILDAARIDGASELMIFRRSFFRQHPGNRDPCRPHV